MTNPWQQAQDQAASAASAQNSGQSQLAESYPDKPSGIFGGGQGAGPSLMNKTHPVGTRRTGIIAKAPYDRQSSTMKGEPKYWQQGSPKPVLNATSPSGQPNRPVLDTIIELDTEYQMDAAEAIATNRTDEQGNAMPFDGGRRSVSLAGDKMKAFQKALEKFNASVAPGARITCDADFVGKRLTEIRVATKPNPNGGDPIKIHEYEIADADV